MSLESLKSKKDLVLNKTIAHSILMELKELRSDPTQGRRCLIELIQNAIDTAKGSVDAEIVREGDKVVFSHNGRPFTDEELINLVYHGSSKGNPEETSGRLGTGFLASHLISMKTTITSSLEGKMAFAFSLDREAQDAGELSKKMQKSWDELEEILGKSRAPSNEKTSYEYVMSTEEQMRAYELGATLLKETAPAILALDKRLNSISIKEDGQIIEWKVNRESTSKGSEIVDIQKMANGNPEIVGISRFIVRHEGTVSVAMPLEQVEEQSSFADISSLPKLYYPLPFIDSSAFPFPALISDRGFISTRTREAPSLTLANEADVQENKKKMEVAFKLVQELLREAIEPGHYGLHNLGRLPRLIDTQNFFSKHKVDHGWLGPFVSQLIDDLRGLDIVLTPNGFATPKSSKMPYMEENGEQLLALWKLVSKLYPKSVPVEELAKPWGEILGEWIDHREAYGGGEVKMDEVVTLERLANTVEGISNLTELQSKIEGITILDWINNMIDLILSAKKNGLLETKKILPTQDGTLQTSKPLYRDPGIPEDLKEIASNLGYDVKSKLLHRGLTAEVLDKSLTENDVLLEVLKLVKDKARSAYATDAYQKANVELFNWLAKQRKFNEIRDSFPILTHEKEDGGKEYVRFFTNEGIFLSPPSTWGENDRSYADVFPSRAILSGIYSSLLESCWKELEVNGLVLRKLVTRISESLGVKGLRVLCIDEIPGQAGGNITHASKGPVSLTSLPFMREKDWGVFDRIDDSRPRAARFLSFVMENLIKTDPSWKQPIDIECVCGSNHKVRPSLWLEAIATRQWVPVSGGDPERPSSENLAEFFAQENLHQTLADDDSSFFLAVLGVSVSAIVTANKSKSERIEYEKAVSKLIVATGMDASQLSLLATAYSDEDARLELLNVLTRKKLVHDNQKIGKLVERLVREQLGKALAEAEFSVSRVTIASDAKVEATIPLSVVELVDYTDYESDILDEEGNEELFQVSGDKIQHLIEVKSARGKEVRMTVPQAQKAHSSTSSFSLCVVPIDSSIVNLSDDEAAQVVLKNARFVHPIGDKLGTALSDIDSILQGESKQLSKAPEDVEAVILGNRQLRVRIREPIWDQGLDFGAFVNLLISGKDLLVSSFAAQDS